MGENGDGDGVGIRSGVEKLAVGPFFADTLFARLKFRGADCRPLELLSGVLSVVGLFVPS
jgi:hypothetical protein